MTRAAAGTMAASVAATWLIAAPCRAQTPAAIQCEAAATARKAAWAPAAHAPLANDWEAERREIGLAWCRMRASSGAEKVQHAEDLQALLFTGAGVHPEAGTITPGNGIAVGAQIDHAFASAVRPLRFDVSVDSRASFNGSWTAGGTLDVFGASARPNPHAHASVDAHYAHLVQASYFGPGNDSANAETRFGLNKAAARATFESAGFHGFSVFGQAGALRAQPLVYAGSGAPSIAQRFTDAVAPALGVATTYLVAGGGANWRYPEGGRTSGYSSGVSAAVRRYQEAAGRPYSFTRSDVMWSNRFAAPSSFDFGTISATARLTATAVTGGNRVPFYLQPTLGGTDINGEGSLRSYHDYRFRQPDLFVAQFDYARTVIEPIGVLLFYDLGKVGASMHDLRPTGLRHSYGAGITIRASDLIYVQAYVAWGGGEGSHTTIGGSTNYTAPDGAARGVF
jgi:hypothetical protein